MLKTVLLDLLVLLSLHVPNSQFFSNHSIIFNIKFRIYQEAFQPEKRMKRSALLTHTCQIKKKSHTWWRTDKGVVWRLTVKLLLTFLVLDSATLASVRSTSSNMMDWRDTGTTVSTRPRYPAPHCPSSNPGSNTHQCPSTWNLGHLRTKGALTTHRARSSQAEPQVLTQEFVSDGIRGNKTRHCDFCI